MTKRNSVLEPKVDLFYGVFPLQNMKFQGKPRGHLYVPQPGIRLQAYSASTQGKTNFLGIKYGGELQGPLGEYNGDDRINFRANAAGTKKEDSILWEPRGEDRYECISHFIMGGSFLATIRIFLHKNEIGGGGRQSAS